jgi:hypothetical protein
MLRASLIVALLAGIAALAVSQLQVVEKINTLTQQRDTYEQERNSAQAAEQKAKREAKDAEAAADKARKDLDTAKSALADASTKAEQQEKRANDLETRLDKTTQERNDAQAALVKWTVFGRSVDEIKQILVDNKKLTDENSGLVEENKTLGRDLHQARTDLAILTGKIKEVPLPPDLKGKVVAVDPKYEFVVLNIGKDDGVLTRGEMLVNRSGRLVAKVRILTTEAHRSVATVLPDWKEGEIMEGDTVIVPM